MKVVLEKIRKTAGSLCIIACLISGCGAAGSEITVDPLPGTETVSAEETVPLDTESVAGSTESLPAETETETETATATASMHLENEKMDLAGLSTTEEGWGMGKVYDDLNRPELCLVYQDRYEDYPVYFLGPWDGGEPKTIYLTFNIGFSNKWVYATLDALREKEVPAVFFSTGNVLWENPETIQQIIADGHDLANHSMHHKMDGMPSLSVEQQEAEIMDMHNMALEDFGYEMHLFRFPSGSFSEQSLAIVNNCNYKSVFWSYTYIDWDRKDQPDVNASLKEAVERLHPGAIYCFHATSETSATMLADFIDQARDLGYEFRMLR